MDRLLGWKKDKYDGKDYLFTAKFYPGYDGVDLSCLLPEVRDQGSVGSCVGFGIGANLCSVAKLKNCFTEWFSPTWIYNGARFIEGTLLWDIGCYPKDALDWLVKHGCLLERFWPYDPNKLDTSAPSSEKQQNALHYKNFEYRRVVDGAAGIVSALDDEHLVSIGNPWFEKWLNPENGELTEVTSDDKVVGGHETIIYGYCLENEVFLCQNSWGTEWGNGGRFTMPFSAINVFKELGGYDAHIITFDKETEDVEVDDVSFWQNIVNFFKRIFNWVIDIFKY